jgi:hypothetical protein
MSDFCEITGMTIDDANKFQYIHSKMIEEYSPKDIDGKYFEKLENELSNSVKRILPHKSDSKQRKSLTNHLSRTLGKKFKASEVKSFGSSVTGLNIKGGDLDLCFVIPDANQKNTIVNMAKVLRGQGMENVQTITNAIVPILKFKDPRSGIRTDISVNNTLALHNTELLRRYSRVDRKVSDFIRLVKYWAFHRNISNPFEGTLSSYAWTILALNYLISEGIIPNLQDTEEKLFIEINGNEYDISMRSSEDIKLTKEMSLSAMICGFFEFYSNWDWSSDVISIRNSGKLSREEIDWEHEEPTSIDLLNLGKYDAKTGKHHLPIQDPFDIGHDLSRVLTANGELKILNEILRARTEIGNGLNWSKLCETVDPERLADLEPEDLFHDIRNLPIKDVENKKTIIQGEINALETKIKAFEQEKSTAIRLANAMKGIIEETSEIRSEHKSIHLGLKERSKEIRELKKERDLINSNIVIPLKYIEEQLAKVYKRLTNELNVRYIPSLEKEISDFSWFFELQEMHKKAKDAENLHNKYVELSKLQHEDIKKLEMFETKHDEVTTKLLDEEPLLKDLKFGKNGAKSYDKRVYNINRAIHNSRSEFQKLRREIGRLDAWLRISKGKGKSNKGRDRRDSNKSGKVTSGPVTLGDLSDLLAQSSQSSSTKKTKKVSSKKAGMKKLGNFSAHRGSRGTYNRKD